MKKYLDDLTKRVDNQGLYIENMDARIDELEALIKTYEKRLVNALATSERRRRQLERVGKS